MLLVAPPSGALSRRAGSLPVVTSLLLVNLACVAASKGFFTSTRVQARLHRNDEEATFPVIAADFGSLPWGRLISLDNVRLWEENYDFDYPSGCSSCMYACEANQLNAMETLPVSMSHTAVAVYRSPPTFGRSDEQHCTFINKVINVQSKNASVVLVLNDRDDRGVTMDTETDDESLQLDELAPPSFLVERQYIEQVKDFLKAARPTGDAKTSVRLEIDFRNPYPEYKKVNVTVWQSRLYLCGGHGDESAEDCHRRADMIGYSGFMRTCKNWVRSGRASFMLRMPNLDQCRIYPQPSWCEESSVRENCIFAGRYCHMDPDAIKRNNVNGRTVLTETLRERCVATVTEEYGRPELYLHYITGFGYYCTDRNDWSMDCSATTFEKSVLINYTKYTLQKLGISNKDVIKEAWLKCVNEQVRDLDADKPNEYLEQDVELDASITIDPTIEVNGHQLRGAYTDEVMVKAMCSMYVDNNEPLDCNNYGTADCSEDGGEGHEVCTTGDYLKWDRTRCQETYQSYTCGCQPGYVKAAYEPTASDKVEHPELDEDKGEWFRCEDRNECESPHACFSYSRNITGVCVNKQGSHECLYDKYEVCNAANSYGGCYVSPDESLAAASGEPAHACRSNMMQLQMDGRAGDASKVKDTASFECTCSHLPCHSGDGHSCQVDCPISECLNAETPHMSQCKRKERSGLAEGAIAGIAVAALLAVAVIAVLGVKYSHRLASKMELVSHTIGELGQQIQSMRPIRNTAYERMEGDADLGIDPEYAALQASPLPPSDRPPAEQ